MVVRMVCGLRSRERARGRRAEKTPGGVTGYIDEFVVLAPLRRGERVGRIPVAARGAKGEQEREGW